MKPIYLRGRKSGVQGEEKEERKGKCQPYILKGR